MPIYEYQCSACGHEFESIQRISDDPLKDCPVCQKPELKKLVSASGFRLKGGGWYETDFKGGDKKKNLASDKSSEAPKKKSDSTKSDSSKSTPKTADSG